VAGLLGAWTLASVCISLSPGANVFKVFFL
jgi:hypothetical protein